MSLVLKSSVKGSRGVGMTLWRGLNDVSCEKDHSIWHSGSGGKGAFHINKGRKINNCISIFLWEALLTQADGLTRCYSCYFLKSLYLHLLKFLRQVVQLTASWLFFV